MRNYEGVGIQIKDISVKKLIALGRRHGNLSKQYIQYVSKIVQFVDLLVLNNGKLCRIDYFQV